MAERVEANGQETRKPALNRQAFACPHCAAFAHQRWSNVFGISRAGDGQQRHVPQASLSRCEACKCDSIWYESELVYPGKSTAPLPAADMPDDVRAEFLEARAVCEKSPRSAAALLRQAVQRLMAHVGEKGENVNADIGSLVKKGLGVMVQQALDSVRVIGNNAVHPGQIDLTDDRATAMALFGLVNVIVERLITHPKHVRAIYDSLPESARAQVATRDAG